MTPEVAEYHRIMLMIGFLDRFERDFDLALEQEDPLSDLILELTSCASDLNRTISALHHYALDHKADEQKVYELVLEDIRGRYTSRELSREQVVSALCRVAYNLDKFHAEPWEKLTYLSYVQELHEDNLLSDEVFNTCFDAWMFRGERPDYWALQRNLEIRITRPKHSKQYWLTLALVFFLILLSFAGITLTVILTGSREMVDFTKNDCERNFKPVNV